MASEETTDQADDVARPVSWAEIDLGALAHNAREAMRLARGRDVIAVVKAEAYGHGAVPVARALLAAGCSRLAVVTPGEALALRDAGLSAPVLVLGGVRDEAEARVAVDASLTPVLLDDAGLARLAKAASQVGRASTAHVEIDTGMRRMGVSLDGALSLLANVEAEPAVHLEGVFTHLACADDADPADARAQLKTFAGLLAAAREQGIAPPIVHAHNSAGLMAGLVDAIPEVTAVRPGLMLYGVAPAPWQVSNADLRPVMTWRARVVRVESVSPGESVGYGATWRAERATRIATLPVGYADGVPWTAANRGEVWLAGARRPVVGRISMDSITIDVGDAGVSVGDEAVLFGTSPAGDAMRVEAAAERAGTLSYELLVRVGGRVPRIFSHAG